MNANLQKSVSNLNLVLFTGLVALCLSLGIVFFKLGQETSSLVTKVDGFSKEFEAHKNATPIQIIEPMTITKESTKIPEKKTSGTVGQIAKPPVNTPQTNITTQQIIAEIEKKKENQITNSTTEIDTINLDKVRELNLSKSGYISTILSRANDQIPHDGGTPIAVTFFDNNNTPTLYLECDALKDILSRKNNNHRLKNKIIPIVERGSNEEFYFSEKKLKVLVVTTTDSSYIFSFSNLIKNVPALVK